MKLLLTVILDLMCTDARIGTTPFSSTSTRMAILGLLYLLAKIPVFAEDPSEQALTNGSRVKALSPFRPSHSPLRGCSREPARSCRFSEPSQCEIVRSLFLPPKVA